MLLLYMQTPAFLILKDGIMQEIKAEKGSRRSRYTVQAIKDAFLETEKKKMFNEISITEICREAHVSRSTFYQYYNNLAEVLADVLVDVGSQCFSVFTVHKLMEEPCADDDLPKRERFCEFVRREKKYRGLFLDESLTSKIINELIDKFHNQESDLFHGQINASDDTIRTYRYFQLNGCLSVIRKTLGQSDEEWKETRQTLDRIVESSVTIFRK